MSLSASRSKWILLGGSLALAPALSGQSPPNVIYILCDDMGYGDLGCYGQPFIDTPHIDRMAQEGMRFTQAYAGSPVSAPSRACLMTGQHSGHTEVRGNKEYWRKAPLVQYGVVQEYSVTGQHPYDPGRIILPEIFKENGYTTGMFGKWAGGYEGSVSTPDKRGFDEFYGYIFSLIEADKEAHGYFAGCNFWGWGGFAEPSKEHIWWAVGDDYTGDPAQEQQGLNSVFVSDASTCEIIHAAAEKLK